MELRRSFDLRKVTILTYFVLMAFYVLFGFTPTPVEATKYEVSSELTIPSIGLSSDVTSMKLYDGQLDTPDTIVGSFSNAENKTFLVGHRKGVFSELENVEVGDEIIYDYTTYVVQKTEVLAKDEISMNALLRAEDVETLVVMTCASEDLPGGDATHRLIITASVQ